MDICLPAEVSNFRLFEIMNGGVHPVGFPAAMDQESESLNQPWKAADLFQKQGQKRFLFKEKALADIYSIESISVSRPTTAPTFTINATVWRRYRRYAKVIWACGCFLSHTLIRHDKHNSNDDLAVEYPLVQEMPHDDLW